MLHRAQRFRQTQYSATARKIRQWNKDVDCPTSVNQVLITCCSLVITTSIDFLTVLTQPLSRILPLEAEDLRGGMDALHCAASHGHWHFNRATCLHRLPRRYTRLIAAQGPGEELQTGRVDTPARFDDERHEVRLCATSSVVERCRLAWGCVSALADEAL